MQPSWEIWIDANISPIIAKWMADYTGLIIKSSFSLSLHGMLDKEIYSHAKACGNVIFISKDSDFSDIINRLGSPPKLILIEIGNCDNKELWEKIKPKINDAIKILSHGEIDIVVLS